MDAPAFSELRDLVRVHAARRGWRSQRQIAVMCGLDETALSRFLNGEQDIGARRTHALFQAVGVPVAQYDLAYALLGRAQAQARVARERRSPEPATVSRPPRMSNAAPADLPSLQRTPSSPLSPARLDDLPASILVARFAVGGFSGEQIAAFFAGAL